MKEVDEKVRAYEEKRKTFMAKMDYYDDGHASEAVVNYILKLK